jgi:excisionase family DNA binding protein
MTTSRTTAGKAAMAIFEEYSDIVTVRELCRMLKIGRNTAYDLLNREQIKSIRIGRKYLIPTPYIISYLNVQKDSNYTSDVL